MYKRQGSTSCSINCLMRVLLPVRTGPTTPIRISPPVRAPISRETAVSYTHLVFAILSTIFNIAGPKILAKATTALATGWIAKLRGSGSIDLSLIHI